MQQSYLFSAVLCRFFAFDRFFRALMAWTRTSTKT